MNKKQHHTKAEPRRNKQVMQPVEESYEIEYEELEPLANQYDSSS